MELQKPGRPVDEFGASREDGLDYLYDMLGQLSDLAAYCGEAGIALVLRTIVVSKTGQEPGLEPEGRSSLDLH